jgi:hypothetical protein
VLLTAAAAASAEASGAGRVRLSSRDRAEVSRVACASLSFPEADAVEASTDGASPSLIRVSVRCGAHRREGALPVARMTNCTNAAAKWTCASGYEVLTAALPGVGLLTVTPDGLPMTTAAAVIAESVALSIPPFYKPLAPLLIPECTLRQDGRAPFQGATLFKLACTNWEVEVTRDCGVRPCRHFVVRADRKPRV